MFETASSALAQYIPEAMISLPLIGMVDIQKLIIAVGLFVVISAAAWLLQLVFLVRLESLAQKTVRQFDDTVVGAIKSVRPWVYNLVAFYVALQLYNLPMLADQIISGLLYFAFVWQGIQVVKCFIHYAVTNYIEKDEDGDGIVDPAAATASDLITLISSIVLWVLGTIFVLSNIGIEVTSLIAGLGIGGIAIAFALQGVLTDLFASFSIYFDKPFRIGDYVVIGADSGTVEKIGIKSTRIRTLQGEELVVSNSELTTVRVQNFKKMEERRISSQFGITYETPQEKVQMVNGIVERAFEDIEGARLDRVHFTTFADSALLFDVVYHVESADYANFLDIQQTFNFTLMERFAELGIEFAYPTQTIYTKTIS
ncbi:MAG: small-conductance mechanosensitive channel [Candidatus Paceibacteria bacterium]|jgi:small-conductance mechanosensitive channel